MKPRLSQLIIILRDLRKGVDFYGNVLKLPVRFMSDNIAELDSGHEKLPIILKRSDKEAECSVGYSPFLSFEVKDLDEVVIKAIEKGGALDGTIKHEVEGKAAVLRSPDGHMIACFERESLSNI